jgi:hypothetical protein
MRRMIISAAAAATLAVPGVALARAERHHHHHGRHHHHAHVLAFHAQAPAGSTRPTSTAPAQESSGDSAGKIASFEGGVLAITLNDGSTVSGKVTERTEIECPAPTASAADFSRGGSDGGGNDESGRSPSGGDDGELPERNDNADDDANDEAEHCTTAALLVGASVREAFLSVGSGGATWLKVEL